MKGSPTIYGFRAGVVLSFGMICLIDAAGGLDHWFDWRRTHGHYTCLDVIAGMMGLLLFVFYARRALILEHELEEKARRR
jgi:hypothetical protein